MPWVGKYVFNLRNSPPLSKYNVIKGKSKYFLTRGLNFRKIENTYDLFLNGYYQIYFEKWSTKFR